jgi:2-polyprenyl-3-methyl-5-hydroxy-6-metoxy-1,4-benzoquinol methylase
MIETWSEGPVDDAMPEQLLVSTMESVQRHPWWKARAKIAVDVLAKFNVQPPARIFDVGCGWGTNLAALEKAGYGVVGFDISRRVLRMIDRADRHLIEADLTCKPPSCFKRADALVALDVLEHIDDDREATANLSSMLMPAGFALISVPALPRLYSEFDALQGHRRRYTPETLRRMFEGTNLKVRSIFWWGAWMVPILGLTRHKSIT